MWWLEHSPSYITSTEFWHLYPYQILAFVLKALKNRQSIHIKYDLNDTYKFMILLQFRLILNSIFKIAILSDFCTLWTFGSLWKACIRRPEGKFLPWGQWLQRRSWCCIWLWKLWRSRNNPRMQGKNILNV